MLGIIMIQLRRNEMLLLSFVFHELILMRLIELWKKESHKNEIHNHVLYHVVLLETAVIQIEEDKKIIKWKKMKYPPYLFDEGALHPMKMMMNETVEKGKNKMMLHVNLLHVVLLREIYVLS